MIHSFDNPRLMFPIRWANSVASWISGICSPSSTIRIQNELNPGNGESAKLDVDIEVVYNKLRERLDRDYVSKSKINETIDSKSLINSDGILSVNPEFVREIVRST